MKHSRIPVQRILLEFHNSDKEVLRVPIQYDYCSINSAQNTWNQALCKLNYNMFVRTVDGVLYIVKKAPDYKNTRSCRSCLHCDYEGYYNPDSPICDLCVNHDKWEAKR